MTIKTTERLAYIVMVIPTAILIFSMWALYAHFKYPCEAYKTGLLSTAQLPGRCVK